MLWRDEVIHAERLNEISDDLEVISIVEID